MSILDRIKALLQRSKTASAASIQPPDPEREPDAFVRLDRFMRMVENTREDELSCDDVHWLMAQYAEALEQGQDPAALMPLVKQHLDMCHECHEELEALLAILEATKA